MPKKTLPLKAVQPYEIRVCSLTGQCMFGGDWYYEDEDGKIYLYEAYHQRKEEVKRDKFDYNKLLEAQSQAEYKQILKQYQQEVIQDKLDKEFDKGE